MEALTNDTSEAVSFIISVMFHCFLTVRNAVCIVDVGVVGGTRTGAVVLSTVQLFNHAAHLISPASEALCLETRPFHSLPQTVLYQCTEIKGLHFILQALC